jgi:hypothetical protein
VVTREIASEGGAVWVRVRAATAGDLIVAGLGGTMEPGAAPKRRGLGGSKPAPDVAGIARATEALVQTCLLGVGDTADSIEPVTVRLTESDAMRPGTRPLDVYVVPADVLNAVGALVIDISVSEAMRAKAAAFPPADSRDG